MALAGRDGFSNGELVAMWPRVPNERCSRCGERGFVTWRMAPVECLCDDCLSIQGGTRA